MKTLIKDSVSLCRQKRIDNKIKNIVYDAHNFVNLLKLNIVGLYIGSLDCGRPNEQNELGLTSLTAA